MKKSFLAVVVSMLLAVPLIFMSASPASAACTASVNTKNSYKSVLDDETNGYIKVYVSIYFDDCGTYRTFKYLRTGYAPDTRYNSTLRCGSTLGHIDRVRINVGALGGNNPAEWDADCLSGGTYKTYDWANYSVQDSNIVTDTCAGAHWTAVLPTWNDQSGDVPLVCF